MPMIILTTNQSLNDDQQSKLQSLFGESMNLLSGKTPEQLMLSINDETYMTFRGLDQLCAFIELKIYNTPTDEDRLSFTKSAIDFVSDICNIPRGNIYLVVTPYPNWGKG